jgi:ribonucleoside-diphosphate reductase subunit M2
MASNALTRLTSYLPVADQELFDLYQQAKMTFWTEDEIDLTNDLADWGKLSDNEQSFISHILGFFVQSDQLVNINLGDRFVQDLETIPSKYNGARLFYNFQISMEDIHTLTYETLLNAFITDPSKLLYFKNAIKNIPAVRQKANWAVRYIDDKQSNFLIRLIAFAILEGIFFSGSFCAIFWIGKRNLMPGLINSNELISRDEHLHYEFALTLFRKLRDDPDYNHTIDKQIICKMIVEAVAIEAQFINESISCDMIGMNVTLMSQYIQFVADTLLRDINMDPIYDVANPFDFMNELGLCNKANFFERRETVYQKSVAGVLEYDSDSDNDF